MASRLPVDDLKLIELVREQPVLYTTTHEKYGDIGYKKRLWKDIGKQLGTNYLICKARWHNLRDQYRKKFKKDLIYAQLGMKIKPRDYKYKRELSFLDDLLGDIQIQKNHEAAASTDEDCHSVTDVDGAMHESLVNKFEVQLEPLSNEPISPNPEEMLQDYQHHPIDAFLAGISPTLKSLSKFYQNVAKTEIFQIVQKYEMQMLTGFDGMQTTNNT